jgi:hypothetical protein
MAGYAVIAAITRAMVDRLQNAITTSGGPVSHATVTARQPDQADGQGGPRVNLFLYHAQPSPWRRNDEMPLRSASGQLQSRCLIALDLFYLVSVFGSDHDSSLETQLLFGLTVATLGLEPNFDADDLANAWLSIEGEGPPVAEALGEPVRLTHYSLETEAMARLWQSFVQAPFALSMVYRASPVMVPAGAKPDPLPVVKRRQLTTARMVQGAKAAREAP